MSDRSDLPNPVSYRCGEGAHRQGEKTLYPKPYLVWGLLPLLALALGSLGRKS